MRGHWDPILLDHIFRPFDSICDQIFRQFNSICSDYLKTCRMSKTQIFSHNLIVYDLCVFCAGLLLLLLFYRITLLSDDYQWSCCFPNMGQSMVEGYFEDHVGLFVSFALRIHKWLKGFLDRHAPSYFLLIHKLFYL